MELEEHGNGLQTGLRTHLQLSLRTRILMGGVVLLSILFATIVVGIVETVQIIDQRSGPPAPGPEEWLLVETVVRDPVDRPPFPIRDIFLNTAELVSLGEVVWFEEIFHREKVRLFQPPGNWELYEGSEYIPHVVVFEDVPGDAVETDSLEKLAEFVEEGLVGLVFFAGELFGGGSDLTSWSRSPVAEILPVYVEEMSEGIDARMRVKDRGFAPFKGFDFSTFPRIQAVTRVVPKPGAKVAATALVGGEQYPLLVWWEVNGARVLVWTGSFGDIFNWETDEFYQSGGRRGGPLFARKLVYFAAERGGEGSKSIAAYGSFKILMDIYEPGSVSGLRIYISREKAGSPEAQELAELVWDYVFIAPGVLRPGLEPGVEYVLTDELIADIKAALT